MGSVREQRRAKKRAAPREVNVTSPWKRYRTTMNTETLAPEASGEEQRTRLLTV